MKKPSEKQLEQLATALNYVRDEALADIGERDANYIRRIVRIQRGCEVSGRMLIYLGILNPVAMGTGIGLLGLSKILDNMEIGHNVIHGQYDWMNDHHLHSQHFDWDNACPAESWKNTHNFEHHTYTNILGKDRDYGYDVLRLTHEQPWKFGHIFQFGAYLGLSSFFQWGVALHELDTESIKRGDATWKDKLPFIKQFARKGARQFFKDYLFFPLLAGPFFLHIAAANAAANLIRNLWSSTIIFCGHFPEDVQTFSIKECENESKGHWYYRQMLGSANFTGSRWLHILSGHLSCQIEHHLFPDIPAHRYPELSEKVQAIADEFGIPYNTGTFLKQYRTVLNRIWTHSFPKPKNKTVLA